jgi:hypothetical protein
MKKTGNYYDPIIIGAGITTLGIGLLINLDPTANWPKIIIYEILAGIGLAANFQCPALALLANLPPQEVATANATYSLVRYMSFAISVVIGSTVFRNSMQKRQPALQSALGPQIARLLSGDTAEANVKIVGRLPPGQRAIAHIAFQRSLRTVWILYVSISAALILFSLLIRKLPSFNAFVLTVPLNVGFNLPHRQKTALNGPSSHPHRPRSRRIAKKSCVGSGQGP